jgi:hypothetical protein
MRMVPAAPKSKTPLVAQWPKRAAPYESWIDERWTPDLNWAVLLGEGRLVVDVDPVNGGDESFKTLTGRYGQLPPTWTVDTPKGGCHYWLSYDPSLLIPRRTLPAFGGIDFLAEKSLAMVPHSATSRGKYRWRVGFTPKEFPKMSCAPPWLLSLLQGHKTLFSSSAPSTALPTPQPLHKPSSLGSLGLWDAWTMLRDLSPDCSYMDWIKICSSLVAAFPTDQAWWLFHSWSRGMIGRWPLDPEAHNYWPSCRKYDYEAVKKAFTHAVEHPERGNPATLIYLWSCEMHPSTRIDRAEARRAMRAVL